MDVQSKIIETLDSKGYDDFTKIRWIYLFVCKMFSYDIRYCYCNSELRNKIYNKQLDLRNVDDFEIVCSTFSKILIDALALFGIKGELYVCDGKDMKYPHVCVIVKHNGHVIKMDPTKRHDVTRIKMNFTTIDFESLNEDDDFLDEILAADKEIEFDFDSFGYDKSISNKLLKNLVFSVERMSEEQGMNKKEKVERKINIIHSLINQRTDFHRYDDIFYYYSYLLKKFKVYDDFDNDGNKKTVFVNPVNFFRRTDKNMTDIVNITYAKFDSISKFYLLKKDCGSFVIREIFREEAFDLLREYESETCQLSFESAALRLSKTNQNGIVV